MKLSNFIKLGITGLCVLLCLVLSHRLNAQSAIPLELKNTSEFRDDEIYVAIIGKDLSVPANHIWVDCKTGNQFPMSSSYNTVAGPIYNGNKGPGGNGRYANCFTKLSDIANRTIMLKQIQGCRVFFAVRSQLYLYFFSTSGGYAAPDHNNPTDPNTGIKYDFVELTYDNIGFWGNTTRVDRYSYPVGVELFSTDGRIIKAGELKSHKQIGAEFLASVPKEFHGCYNPATGDITFPTKTKDFSDGSIGTMPDKGPYYNYMDPYISAIWSKYTNEDLVFDGEMDGVWRGRIQNGRLTMTCQSGKFAGRRGIVERKPTTQEAFEGKGVLDKVIQDGETDLVVQKHLCAAITRHMINTTTPNVGLQHWGDVSKFYQGAPCNYYAKFWHQKSINVGGMAYGFSYDDVFEQSSTISVAKVTKVAAYFGGFNTNSNNNNAPAISITTPGNNTNFNAPATITINATATDSDGSITKVEFFNGGQKLGEDATSPYTFTWSNVGTGNYTITAIATDNSNNTTTSSPVTVKVSSGSNQSPYGGTAWAIPGTIEAENFDNGGQNVSYYDVTGANEGGAFRSTEVDLAAVAGGGFYWGWVSTGEWLEYTVNVTATGKYKLQARVATIHSGKNFTIQLDGATIATVNVPNTGGWESWTTVEVTNLSLSAGQKVLRINASTSEFNIDKLTFASESPSGVVIQAENFNYASSVIKETTRDTGGGQNVGAIDNQDWMAFSNINIPNSGYYTIEYRVASIYNNGKISLDLNAGSVVLGEVAVPYTGDWQVFTTVAHTVYINAGNYSFGLFAKAGGWNINWWKITPVSSARLASVEQAESTETFSIGPNPADQHLFINAESDMEGGVFRVLNPKGTEVLSGVVTNNLVDIRELKSGIYTLIITDTYSTYTKNFIKN